MSEKREKADRKVVIIGDSSVGKTSLIRRYMEGNFIMHAPSTIGASFFVKQWNGKNIALWDTAGQEQFEGIREFYSRGAHAMILCYDICDRISYRSLITKHSNLFSTGAENCVLVFVGTKSDLINKEVDGIVRKRAVTVDEVMESYLEYKNKFNSLGHPQGTIPIFETSSMLDHNVSAAFEHIFETLVPSDGTRNRSSSGLVHLINRGTSEEQKEKKCCNV